MKLRAGREARYLRGVRAALVAMVSLGAAGAAHAEDWHEAYRAGMQSLARGEAERAVASLRRAVAGRPEPGRNVVTYGTNFEPRYYPYLRLTEAYLALGQLALARDALDTSAKWGQEPHDERQKLEARLAAALVARQPPPAAAPPPPAATEPASTTPATTLPAPSVAAQPSVAPTQPPAVPSTLPAAPSEPAGERRESARSRDARVAPEPARPPQGTAPLEGPASPAPGTGLATPTGALEIVSQPPGALAYLDDEPLGSTDPESGRLLKPDVAPGRHRVRVEIAGYQPAARDVEIPPSGTASFYATLSVQRRDPAIPASGWLAFAAVAVSLALAVGWMVMRRPNPTAPVWSATPRPTPRGSATPPGIVNPGARADEAGDEWFGEYRLLELLGRGGMAAVWKAERGSELLALKRPLGNLLGDPDFLERFLREADIGRTLNHPNIVRILGRGEVEGVPYFTMELLAGQTLQGYLHGWGAAEPRTAAAIVAQVAEALDFAHGKGVTHRDLKPSNIMLLPDGSAKVMDFGIAHARRFEGLTATGSFLGTPEYVAPEVIEGGRAEPRSDLYSLGVVFFEVLTGRRPFSAENAFAILKKHCSEEPPAPSSLQQGIPPELDALVLRLLAKAKEARPQSAEELVVALRDWLNRARS